MLDKLLGSIIATLLLAGCANNSTAFRTFSVEKSESVSIDAKQRTILTAKRDLKAIVCAEPSPDVLAALGASLGAAGGYEGVQAKLSAALSESAQELGIRNASIQLLRDGLYRACEAYMNGALNDFQYTMIASRYADIMVTLLAIEQLTTLKRPSSGRTSVAAGGAAKTSTEVGAKTGTTEATAAESTASATTPSTPATTPTVSAEEVVAIAKTVEVLVSQTVSKDYRGLTCLYYYSARAGEGAEKKGRNASDVRPPLERYCDSLYSADPSQASGKER